MASVVIKLSISIIRGINDNRLISSPIHAPKKELEEIVNIDPKIKQIKKIILEKLK